MAWDSPSHHAILLQEGVRPFNSTAFSASRKPLKDPLLPSCSAAFLQLTSHPNGDCHALLQEAKEERPSFKEEEGSGGAGRDADPIGLKLGKRTYFEDSSSFVPNHSNGNGNSNGTDNTNTKAGGRASKPAARCQVEGCKADLSTAKDYHRRHKVCDPHSKSPSAVVSGIEQRFCQQCSRFHVASEFDEGKRSCRRRLASHNERRRKPKMDPLTMRLPALQSDACFSQFFLPRNSLPYSRTSGLPPYWEVSEQSKGYWSNSWNTGNDTLLATEMGRQLFQQGNNTLFFSPPNSISTQRGFQGVDSSSSDLIGEGLSLCSPPGSIAFSPLEATANGTAIPATTTSTGSITGRHSNSGCALSLLSLLQPATSLDLCMHSDMGTYQSLHVSAPSASSQPFIGGYHFGLDSDRTQKIGFNSDADRMWKIGFDYDRMQQVGFDSDRMRQIGSEESDRMRQIGLDSNRIRQMGLDSDRMRQIGLDPDDRMRQIGLDLDDRMRDRMRQIGLDSDDRMRQIGLDSNANRLRQIGLNPDDRMRRIGLDSDRLRQIGLDSDDRIQKIGLDSDSMRQIGLDSDFDQMRQIGLDPNRMRQIKHARDENATIDLMHVAPFSSRSSYDQSYLHAPSQGGGSQLGPNPYGNLHGLRSYGTFSI